MEASQRMRRRAARAFGWGFLLCWAAQPGHTTAQPPPPPTPAPLTTPNTPAAPNAPAAGRQPAARDEELPEPQRALTLDPRAALRLPPVEPGEEALPISLPAALRLANVRAWDIDIAVAQERAAAAQLLGARVLWLPTIVSGVDYVHHDGPLQTNLGTVPSDSRSSLYVGTAPLAIFNLTDAIFAPLAQRQVVRAQQANIQTATNDTLTQVAQTYFDVLESRADLASIEDVAVRSRALVYKTESLAPGLIPDVEVARVRAADAAIRQGVEVARQRWRVNSAELFRVLRLDPAAVAMPLESPLMQITLISPERAPGELIPIAETYRPENAFNQAQVEAARQRVRQERLRPLLPNLIARGAGSTPPYPLAFGAYAGGQGGGLNNFGVRDDFDLEAIWELRNLGLGNLALVREKEANLRQSRDEDYRVRDVVAKEVVQEWANVRSAYRRIPPVEVELREALISAVKNLQGLGETKRAAGNIVILVIRPQEAVQALQALNAAYFDYFGVIADYNRAQFRLYRALGNPAQQLAGNDSLSQAPQGAGCPIPAPRDAVAPGDPVPPPVQK
jgi:outer membrane protein TolC